MHYKKNILHQFQFQQTQFTIISSNLNKNIFSKLKMQQASASSIKNNFKFNQNNFNTYTHQTTHTHFEQNLQLNTVSSSLKTTIITNISLSYKKVPAISVAHSPHPPIVEKSTLQSNMCHHSTNPK